MVNSFNHFRAIAIIFIVAGHSYTAGTLYLDDPIEIFIGNILIGGTALFVFISGFLFHQIFYRSFRYSKFVKSKFKNVLAPYIILGLAPIAYRIFSANNHFEGYYLATGSGLVSEYLLPYVKYFVTGNFLTAYWYIPFIIATFLLSPLHVKFIETKRSVQIAVVTLLSLVSMLIHRPVDNIGLAQSVVYFTPIYLIGILCSIHRTRIYAALSRYQGFILLAVLALSALQTSLGHVGNYHKEPFIYGGLDLLFMQKILMCLFFMLWLNRYESKNNRVLDAIAATSFTTFFFHPIILYLLSIANLQPDHESALYFAGLVAVIMIICVLTALLIKRLIPKYSRYLTGY